MAPVLVLLGYILFVSQVQTLALGFNQALL